jgi:cell division septation protein DedD
LNISAVQVQQAVPSTPTPENAPEEIAVKDKTSFTIKLESFDAASKVRPLLLSG